jgi:hypothetical protein
VTEVRISRCPRCRKAFDGNLDDFDLKDHLQRCPGTLPGGDDGVHRIEVGDGQGIYCGACGRNRRTLWADPDFCCATCKAVLLTVGSLG